MNLLKYGNTLQFDTKIFVNIIITDYLLRETVQREESVRSSEKQLHTIKRHSYVSTQPSIKPFDINAARLNRVSISSNRCFLWVLYRSPTIP